MVGPRLVILGSGIAGLVAGHELARRGLAVTVLEAAPMAGGRTSTWRDGQGREVDTGLHVVADHYVNFTEVLGQVRANRDLHWVGKHTYLQANRPPMAWYFSPYRPPFHLLRPAREMPLSLAERLAMGVVGTKLASMTQADLATLDDVTYAEWHHRHRLGRGFILDLAEAACDAATFQTVEDAAARPVLSWLKYLMRNRFAGDVGLFQGTLAEALVNPLVRSIEAAGGQVRTRRAATGFVIEGRRVVGVRTVHTRGEGALTRADGRVDGVPGTEAVVPCDHLISALPVQGLQALLSPELAADAGLAPMLGLTTTPAMSVIVWFDRRIEPMPEGAPLCTGCVMRDFIDLRRLGREAGAPGSVYQFVLTRARERASHTDAQVVADAVADLKAVWPAAAAAQVVDAAVERIGAAMFAAVPGAHVRRPGVTTALGGLHLAGDWTHHEYNASMEGAAFSGRRAANAVLTALGLPAVRLLEPPDPTVIPALRRWVRRAA